MRTALISKALVDRCPSSKCWAPSCDGEQRIAGLFDQRIRPAWQRSRLLLAWIPAERRTPQHQTLPRTLTAIDIVAVAGFGATLPALLMFSLSLPHPRWVARGLAAALGGGLLWWELRASVPFDDARMLIRTAALVRAYLRFALTICMYCVRYGVTQWLQTGRWVSAKTTGLLLFSMTGVAALIAQPVAAHNALRAPLIAVGVACLIGSIGTPLLSSHSPIGWLLLVTLISGIALGTTTSANQTALYAQAPSEQIVTASGLLRSCGHIGSIAAAAVISVAFHSAVTDQGLHVIAWILVSVIGLATLALDPIVALRPGHTSSTQSARSKAQTT